jgi:hypothetical protein
MKAEAEVLEMLSFSVEGGRATATIRPIAVILRIALTAQNTYL